jgi:hypothetical protein
LLDSPDRSFSIVEAVCWMEGVGTSVPPSYQFVMFKSA